MGYKEELAELKLKYGKNKGAKNQTQVQKFSNIVNMFCSGMIDMDLDCVPSKEVYKVFIQYCNRENINEYPEISVFSEIIHNTFPTVKSKKIRFGKDVIACFFVTTDPKNGKN